MCQCFPKPYENFSRNTKVEFDLSYYEEKQI